MPQFGIIDPFYGMKDIENRVLRAVGRPEKRFEEDALRILRAVRFISRLGFTAEENTKKAMHEKAGLIKCVSGERIFSELIGIITGDYAERALAEYGDVISVPLPEIKPLFGFDAKGERGIDAWARTCRAVGRAGKDRFVRLCVLLKDIKARFGRWRCRTKRKSARWRKAPYAASLRQRDDTKRPQC
jgi:tRNA nucleotidyltransferase (CCA-adding enzyme)